MNGCYENLQFAMKVYGCYDVTGCYETKALALVDLEKSFHCINIDKI
jgi:hypothetical protein